MLEAKASICPTIQKIYFYIVVSFRYLDNLTYFNNNVCLKARSLVVSDLRLEAKGSRFESCYATFVQSWALCSNRQANI